MTDKRNAELQNFIFNQCPKLNCFKLNICLKNDPFRDSFALKKMKVQKAIFTYLILITLLQILAACVGNKDNQSKEVSLQVIESSNGIALLVLSNNTNKSIYTAYSPSDINNSRNGFVYYSLDCKGKADKESKDYAINTHGAPILDALEQDKSIRFEVSPLRVTEAVCKISVMFYEDENIANLINNKNPELTESEIELVERSKRFVELTFDPIKK